MGGRNEAICGGPCIDFSKLNYTCIEAAHSVMRGEVLGDWERMLPRCAEVTT